jgi:hypothetical protein
VSLDFIGENRLLFTFRTPGLIRRAGAKEDDVRQIRAVVLTLPQGTVEKRIEAGSGFRMVAGRRTHSMVSALWYPDEPRLASAAAWIDVEYPSAEIEFLGLRWHWLVWFTIISMAAALLFKKRFGVVL